MRIIDGPAPGEPETPAKVTLGSLKPGDVFLEPGFPTPLIVISTDRNTSTVYRFGHFGCAEWSHDHEIIPLPDAVLYTGRKLT